MYGSSYCIVKIFKFIRWAQDKFSENFTRKMISTEDELLIITFRTVKVWEMNNSAGFFITLELHWNFSSIPKDGSDIHGFFNRKWVSTMWTVGNL